jgi:ABC-type transporter Mla subunit MlaD
MARRIFSGILILLSSLFLMASVLGLGLVWVYNEPLTREAVARATAADDELVSAQTAIRGARAELERVTRIVDAAEKAFTSFKQQREEAKQLIDQATKSLNNTVIPGIQSARTRLNQLRGMIQGVRQSLEKINALPIIRDLQIPGDEFLSGLIGSIDSLNGQINTMQELIQKASLFTSDTSFLLAGDMTETRAHITSLRDSLREYDRKVTGYHVELRRIIKLLPVWIDRASWIATVFLAWFTISQFGLLLHGLHLRDGGDPLAPLRRPRPPEELVSD